MDSIKVPATDLRAGDQAPDYHGQLAYTVQSVRRATAAQARQVPDMVRGDIIAVIQWVDGGLGERWWPASSEVSLLARGAR